ncbi:glycosyltransferase family A protein [Flavobacterium segetis]|nr:glycosyltransferase family A protein [Flavobacterium segetis]
MPIATTEYLHQIVIPVYIPNHEGYFKDSLAILKLCLQSLLSTVHSKTFITVVNNGSSNAVDAHLKYLFQSNQIQELINTENIGKLNAILKGIVGNNIELVTISDADVLFLPNWQMETVNIFAKVPKAGVVGIVPQFKMYESNCGNVLFNNLFNAKIRFTAVKNKLALIRFYDSLGWDRKYNQDYLQCNLALKIDDKHTALIGSGHFVATYKKDIFETVVSFIGFKMGGHSEGYLDRLPLDKDYWRLTTQDNYAYHMGNVLEDWMQIKHDSIVDKPIMPSNFQKQRKINSFCFFLKNRLFVKFISVRWMMKLFLKWKKLPKGMINNFNSIGSK